MTPQNPYLRFVEGYRRLADEARQFPLGSLAKSGQPLVQVHRPTALIFSPHPDDEVIIGAIALRLLREARWNVANVAVTLGSKKERQLERLAELRGCCDYIGFELIETKPRGLERVNIRTREEEPAIWSESVSIIAEILANRRPHAILIPHEDDWNATHIGTHHVVIDALRTLGTFSCYVIETEFWGAMSTPNLIVEVSAEDLADLIGALTFHVGEVKRNPYHLTLPAWMIDNVRRGAELVGGQGGAAPSFVFATLYRFRQWRGGKFCTVLHRGMQISAPAAVDDLFQ
jgi:N-acetylglucosamine malate deacetylase 1